MEPFWGRLGSAHNMAKQILNVPFFKEDEVHIKAVAQSELARIQDFVKARFKKGKTCFACL